MKFWEKKFSWWLKFIYALCRTMLPSLAWSSALADNMDIFFSQSLLGQKSVVDFTLSLTGVGFLIRS